MRAAFYAAVVVVTFSSGLLSAAEPAHSRLPNVIVLLADDLGYNDTGCYGAQARHVRTPNIDRLAAEGIRFTDGHAASSVCTPSRYSLLTGQYAFRNRLGAGVLSGSAPLAIRPGSFTLPEMFRSRGYATGLVGKWHLGLGAGGQTIDWNGSIKPGPEDVGFDETFYFPATNDRVPTVLVRNRRVVNLDPKDPIAVRYGSPIGEEPTGLTHPQLATQLLGLAGRGHLDAITNGVSRIGFMTGGESALWKDEAMGDLLTGEAVRFIERHKDEPFFLYFAPHNIHEPRIPALRFRGRSGAGTYGDHIVELDDSVGQVMAAIRRLGLENNTLVIFSSDNGGCSWMAYDYGAGASLNGHKVNGRLRGEKGSLWEGGTRVPFIVHWPGRIPASRTSDALVSQTDLLASLARLVGAKVPAQAATDSADVLDAMLGDSTTGRRELVQHRYGIEEDACALRQDQWKWVASQLFNLADDLSESRDLAKEQPDRAKAMANRLRQIYHADSQKSAEDNVLSLAGQWLFQLDADDVGRREAWADRPLKGTTIRLPGTTDLSGIGPASDDGDAGRLTRPHCYVGPAWYQRDIEIPPSWHGKTVRLFLERCLWQSQLWVDGGVVGSRESLSTPHVYDLPPLEPGRHRLTLRIDNRPLVNLSLFGHAYTEETQSLWNGVVGRIELQARDVVSIGSLQAFPDTDSNEVRLCIGIINRSGGAASASLDAVIRGANGDILGKGAKTFTIDKPESTQTLVVDTDGAMGWDEFAPVMYSAEITLHAQTSGRASTDARDCRFGFRKLGADGKQITMNGRPVFLRGTLDCAVYPTTGHPPMDLPAWDRIMEAIKSYGLNHIRFHTWCPPEAAFVAADRAGVLLEVETPLWLDGWMTKPLPQPRHKTPPAQLFGKDAAVAAFIENEFRRILATYGNHPSFCMMGIGNEIDARSDYDRLTVMVDKARRDDPRRLYSVSTARTLTKADQFWVTHASPAGPTRGQRGPKTDWDFGAAIQATSVPIIAHEIGQYVVYPNYAQIAKYQGPLRPRSLERCQDSLARHGLRGRDAAFQQASGALACRLYKAEIEAMLRTPQFGGFQLLGLSDYPGQGEALVGVLDCFWDSKGLISPKDFQQFCSPTVPLLRMGKYTWTADEMFSGRVQVAHYGPEPIKGAVCHWTATQGGGQVVAAGDLAAGNIARGAVSELGQIAFPLHRVTAPCRLRIEASITGTPAANHWDVWVYPKTVDLEPPKDVLVAKSLDTAAVRQLEAGRKVLLLPAPNQDYPNSRRTGFFPVYWSTAWISPAKGTLGFICDPNHPALSAFPNDGHTDWQWWSLAERSRAFVLDAATAALEPIIAAVDDFHSNRRLALVFETRVGNGKLLVCGFDLASDLNSRPASRQLLRSLLDYMQSTAFKPKVSLPVNCFERWGLTASAISDQAACNQSGCDEKAASPGISHWRHPLANSQRLGSPLVEVTPFVFHNRLYLLENHQRFFDIPDGKPGQHFHEDEVRIRDVAENRIVSIALKGHAFATALVSDGRVYVFAGDYGKDKPWRQITEINMTSSDDLTHWTEPVSVIRAERGEYLFNTAVCRGQDRFVLLYETNDARWPAFTFKYCVSDDLKRWQLVPKAIYGTDKYVGGPALYFEGDWYYTLYLQSLGGGKFETRVTRSRDLIQWEDAPKNRPFVTFEPSHHNIPLRPAEVTEKNASDAELCFFGGKTIVYFTGSDQQVAGDLQRAEFAGTPRQLLEHFFDNMGQRSVDEQ